MRKTKALFLALLLVLIRLSAFSSAEVSVPGGVTQGQELHEFSPGSGEGWPYAVSVQENLLLIVQRQSWDGGDLQLTLYDVQVMGKLAGIALTGSPDPYRAFEGDIPDDSGSFEAGFLADGRPYTIDSYSKQLVIYDTKLQAQTVFTPPEGESYFSPFVEPSGKRLWLAEMNSPVIRGFDVHGGKEETLQCALKGNWMFSSFAGMRDGLLLAIFTDDQGHGALHAYDTRTGKLTLRPVITYFSYYLGGGMGFRVKEASALFYPLLGGEEILRVGAWQAGEYPIALADNLVLSSRGPANELRLYDLDRDLILAQFTPPDSGAHYDIAALSAAGFLVLTSTNDDDLKIRFYLWRYTQLPLDQPAEVAQTTMDAIRRENDTAASSIEKAFGIKVHLRREGLAFGNTTYYGTLCDDELTITEGLIKLEAFLTKLPPKLLKEALVDDYTRLGFYLTGPILPRGTEGISSAAGLSSDFAGERYIIFDAFDESVSTTLAHEFMHLLEDQLEKRDQDTGISTLAGFEALSPSGYPNGGYNYGYHDTDGYQLSDRAFTWEADDAAVQPLRVWYIDSYSRSYPLEDRARIFEKLFTAGDALPECFQSPHLMAKAKYLCALIRAAFPLLASGPAPVWEKHIPLPAGGDWSEYLELPLEDAA